ncbi:MAG: lytic transglycosylase domain-containing protein [Bacteroidota bacterium]|nr:lytic transglycosylase domain-containing protein [Bacteroidota bacterium]
MKRLLLVGIAFIGFFPLTQANAVKIDKTFVALNLPIDTSDVKNGLNNLFLASVNGANGARLNPRAVTYVQDFMVRNKEELDDMRSWGRPYFSIIDGILSQYGLPSQLKYLAVIESNLNPAALSWVGAVGPWQFMPATARVLGLKVNHKVDERKNFYKSTRAAAIYLRDLYTELGDWLLVIAAYNGGTGNVYRAMKQSHSKDFWKLQYYLPAESRNHVKKFIGTEYAFEGQGSVTTLTRDEATDQLSGSSMFIFSRKLNKDESAEAQTVTISGKYFAAVISKYIFMDEAEFNRYNPDFDKVMASSNNSYDLKLPADKMELFVSNKYQILNESVQYLASQEDSVSDNKMIAVLSYK